MSTKLETCGRIIHVHQQQLVFKGRIVNIRPKAFSLLLVFLENPFKTLSKKHLLDTVWDDVEVGEQVLFQTINELRQLFENDEVIKTHPRKGYAWIVSVNQYSQVTDNHVSERRSRSTLTRKLRLWYGMAVVLAMIAITAIGLLESQSNENALLGSIVILPMKNNLNDLDHQWVYLGAMDQIISQLESSDTLSVLDISSVLTIMKEANLNRHYQTDKVRRIFDVSGASMVVETELSGYIGRYQLRYALHFKQDVKQGVIFQGSAIDASAKLANLISGYTGHAVLPLDKAYKSEFNNELLVRAIDFRDQGKHLEASELLEALISLEPNNITAKKTLAMSYLSLRRLDEAQDQLLNASQLALQSDSNELPAIFHHLAVSETMKRNFPKAMEYIAIANEHAIAKHNWLFRAYLAQLQSDIEIQQNKFDHAHISLKNALKYNDVIKCPVGTSLTLLRMHSLAKMQGESKFADQYLDQASYIINARKLSFLEPKLNEIRG